MTASKIKIGQKESMKMNKVSLAIKTLVVLAVVFSFTGVNSVSATRAVTDSDTGCFVRAGTGVDDYAFDSACTSHSVLKMDDDGEFDFFVYQDHGQTSWHPPQPYRNTFELCYQFDFGVVCGIAKESVSPGGEYKSSFKSY
jgi:hypothetical protein